jgi:outer membrane protein OmpA-like peptidoglycan-associated protein
MRSQPAFPKYSLYIDTGGTRPRSLGKEISMLSRIWILAVLLALSACAGPRSTFVLIPEPDGSVGSIAVSNQAGSQIIDRPNQATDVASASAAPRPPKTLSAKEINKTWSSAIKAGPRDPKHFLLYFVSGTDQLTKESQALIPEIFASIKEFPAPEVSVVGHTDTVGSETTNATLAMRRAEAVRDLLVADGLDPKMIEVDSHGEKNLLIPTPDNTDEPRNRRVEVTVR